VFYDIEVSNLANGKGKSSSNGHGRNGYNGNGNSISHNKRQFLEKYPEYGTVGATMRAIGVKCRRTFYKWRASDPRFKEIYETELLPNRRDELASMMYRMGTGRLGFHLKTTTYKNGTIVEEEVPNEIPPTQLTAMFGFLKATDHNEDPDAKDRLVFCEKNQVEISGAGGGPVKVEHDAKGKLLAELNKLAERSKEGKE